MRLIAITATMPTTKHKITDVMTTSPRFLRAPLFAKSEGITDTAPGAFEGRVTVGDD